MLAVDSFGLIDDVERKPAGSGGRYNSTTFMNDTKIPGGQSRNMV